MIRQMQNRRKRWRNYVASPIYDAPIPKGVQEPDISVPQPITPSVSYIDPAFTLTPDQQAVLNQIAGQETSIATLINTPPITTGILAPPVAPIIGVEPPPQMALFTEQPSTDIVPQTQYIGMEELANITNEGIIIPPDANVVIIPVNEIKNSELFDTILKEVEANPGVPVQDVISNIVNPNAEKEVIITEQEKQDLINNVAVVNMVQENPGLTVAEAQYNVSEGNMVPVTYIDPVIKPANTTPVTPQEVIKDIKENQQNKFLTTKQIEQIFDLLDKLFGYQSDKNLTKDQVIAKNEDQVYKASGIAVLGILSLLLA